MNKRQVFNPFLPLNEYIPDGEPHVFDDRVYLFGSHDKAGGDTYCMLSYEFWSAPVDDLESWSCKGVSYRADQDPQYGEKLKYEPSLPEKMEIMRRHIGLLVKYKGEIIGMKEARMQTGWYIKGMPGAAKFRAECGSLSTTDDLEKLIENILKGN